MFADRDCRRYVDDLSGFVDKRLSERRLLQVSEHLIRCQRCAGVVDDLRRVRSRLSSCGGAAAPPSALTQRLQSIAGGECDQPLYLTPGQSCSLPTRQKGLERRLMQGGVAVSVALVTLLVLSLALGKEPSVISDPVRTAREQYYVSLTAINVNEGVGAVLWAREQGAEPGPATRLNPREMSLGKPVPMAESSARQQLMPNSPVTFSGLQRVWMMDGDGAHRPSDVEVNVVAGEGASLTVLDAKGDRFLSWFVPATGCCSPHPGSGWSFQTYQVPDRVAGRTAQVIEAVDDGHVTSRWWVDRETGVVLWTERYNTSGYPTLVAGFQQISYGQAQIAAGATTPGGFETTAVTSTPGWCVGMIDCPLRLAGLPLVGVAKSKDGETPYQRLLYSDGLSTLSVTWTEGVLSGAARVVDDSPGQPLVETWQVGNGVLSVTTSGPRKLLATACGELPNTQEHRFSLWERAGSGFKRLLGIG